MVKRFNLLIVLVISLILSSCGDDSQFRITGSIDGLGTRHVYIMYVADGSVNRFMTTAIDGKFVIDGVSSDYTVVEIFSSTKELVGRVLAKNGQTIECSFNPDDYYAMKIKGNKPTEQWGRFLNENSKVLSTGTPAEVNALVKKYVVDNRDNIVSSLLMMTQYDAIDNESQADSLFSLIEPKARPEKLVDDYRRLLIQVNNSALNVKVRPFSLYSYGDSMERYSPSRSSCSLLYFSTVQSGRDTIISTLRKAFDGYPRRRFKLVDVSFTPDTLSWKNVARMDSVGWPQVWAVGGVANSVFDELNIPRLPYFIVADSTGKQLYRGASVSRAVSAVNKRLSH